MTDGERRQSAHPLGNEDVRVPVAGRFPTDAEADGGGGNVAMGSVGPSSGSSFSAQELGVVETASEAATEQLPYPALAPAVFFCLKQTTRPRSWCLKVVCNPWFEHVSMLVILLNCVTLGMFQPCEDVECKSERCTILQAFDDFIFAFFAVEMVTKMVALGIFGQKCYLGDTWNRLDFFIVMAGMLEYSLDGHNASLSAIRTVRVLRPLRAINRVPSMRILVTLLLDTLPMLGNVLLLCFFVFFIFGIVGVQLWAGLLRNRCFFEDSFAMYYNVSLPLYYQIDGDETPFICSLPRDNGMQKCQALPNLKENGAECFLTLDSYNHPRYNLEMNDSSGCINWNQYYNVCRTGDINPHKGAINFDNIGYAWIAIFQVITLEGWVDIMYYVMDAHSFYNFIYFILLIIVGSFFMINLCLVVIATQFSETKQRENQLMQEQRARFLSNDSTIASFSEPGSLYDELLKYICHLFRKMKRRILRLYNSWQNKQRKKVTPNSSNVQERKWRNKGRVRSIHHLIHHHHHHHHHHYHISNGSSRAQQGSPELCDLEMKSLRAGSKLMLPSSSLNHQNPSSGAESVHSIYHADCHFESPQMTCKSSNAANAKLMAGLTHHGGMNYPTIVPSVSSRSSCTPKLKGKRSSNTPITMGKGNPNMNLADSYGKLHHFVGEHAEGIFRAASRLSGLNVPCSAPNTQAGILTCELQNCPYCARFLENPDLQLSDSGSGDSDADGVYEFTQDIAQGDQRDRIHKNKKKPKEKNKLIQLWTQFSEKMKRIVESKYFNRGIMIAILINTLSMGIEYHEQPEELTNVLEISNIVFTSMFALEMILKLLAFGLFGYIKNPYNIFDGIVVIISVWEIIGQSDGGLSVLRTFRLLRVLKLVRFLPALRRQLVVLMKTMDNVATFCMLLMLFIFIFSILGMHLFGCKFSLKTENGDTIPDRKNFDSLLWAIVTVFQILTQEDWNVVLYNGMASTSPWAALYFVALMTFGNYVLFNLLVAILVEGFQAEGDANRSDTDEEKTSANFDDECERFKDNSSELKMYSVVMTSNGHLDSRSSIPPPIIMRTAATPMPTPKSSPYMDSIHTYLESRRGSSASIDPMNYDQRSLSSIRSSPCVPWGTSSNWGSRRSSWHSLGRAPSLKRKNQSSERESLLSGERHEICGEDDESEDAKSSKAGSLSGWSLHHRAESFDTKGSLDLPELLQVPVLRHPVTLNPISMTPCDYQDCNGKSLNIPNEVLPRMDNHKDDPNDYEDEIDDSYCFRIRQFLEPYKPSWCKTHEDWALYLFAPQNRFRIMCEKIIAHKMFDHVVLVFIFLNCITIALERPAIDPKSTERMFLSVSNHIFTAIFVLEMALKVVALGFFSGENAYLQSSWNILDGILVFVSVIDIIVSLASAGGGKILGILRVLRLLRTLRPLRVISRAPGLKLVVETLITSLRPIGNIVLICCAFFIIFGILGVQLFKGKFYHCDGHDTRNITNKSECLQANFKWVRRKYNFDNLGQALMSLFVLSSKDGWVNIMYDGLDAIGIDKQPQRNHNPWMLLYFISFLLIVSFFVLNMFVGVVVENFHKCRQHQEAEEARRREEKRLRRLEKKRRSKELCLAEAQRRPYYADYSPVRLHIHKLCTNHYLDLFITFIIGINVITMSMEHYHQPISLEEALKYCNYVFTIVFVIESILKLVAFGFRRFFKDRWNQLDLAIVLLSIMGITLEEIEMNASLPINPTIIRIMRVLRIARVLKLLKMATGMRALLDTVVQALPQVGNLGLLFMLLFFIYAALGVELFGKLVCNDENPCEGLSRHATFENFGMAFLTLFRVSTGDNWNGIMKDTLRECGSDDRHCLTYLPFFSPVYFVTFVLIAQFVLVNVVVAVLMKHLEESNKEAKEDAELDAEIELEMLRAQGASTSNIGQTPILDGRAAEASQESIRLESPVHVKQLTEDPRYRKMVGENQTENLLTVRKVSVSRMHSLPNDSYMFRPVRSAQTHFPLHEVDSHQGSVTSVQSQPAEVSAYPGVPTEESSRNDSVNVMNMESNNSLKIESSDSLQPKVSPHHILVPPLMHSTPLSPRVTPQFSPPLTQRNRQSSVYTQKQVYSQHSIPSRSPSHSSGSNSPASSFFNTVDPADEEVCYINNSMRNWRRQSEARSLSLSPFLSPNPSVVALKNSNSTTSLAGVGREKDLKKFYSVDAQGLLAKPSWTDDPRRHSIEICPSIDDEDASLQFEGSFSSEEKQEPSAHVQSDSEYIFAAQRKKKTSPPCISIEPPKEGESGPSSHTAATEARMHLRKRTLSFESMAHRDSVELAELQPGNQSSKTDQRIPPACQSKHLTIPDLSFDHSDVNSLSSLSDLFSDSNHSTPSSSVSADSRVELLASERKKTDHLKMPSENPDSHRPENSTEVLSVTNTPLRKRGLIRMVSTREDTDDLVV
ncbi:voltage-dependent T-type calcium channel subunit alpha-1H isoform X3 [Scyliorhinus canicula]|uniref:voltage-dependent T-type calcium channel subunit alpha-1H isoform X3 n=1 Tax=Scyliorhinus canicula TaxID=7830 RepID=UPI0018F42DB2|nr:voltage-dependent T-type calcium channel subunit alpha-1H isoform X3 [Scyliorhinus canicula]